MTNPSHPHGTARMKVPSRAAIVRPLVASAMYVAMGVWAVLGSLRDHAFYGGYMIMMAVAVFGAVVFLIKGLDRASRRMLARVLREVDIHMARVQPPPH